MTQVTLIDGTQADTSSEAWRHECEARAVSRLTSTQLRHEYIAAVRRSRGDAAADALRDLATAIRVKEILGRSQK
jgi:hypothetical protein